MRLFNRMRKNVTNKNVNVTFKNKCYKKYKNGISKYVQPLEDISYSRK